MVQLHLFRTQRAVCTSCNRMNSCAPPARYRVRLPVNPESGRGVVLGEGKPENQNHAIIFCFNETLQAIDMNQVQPPCIHALACRAACISS
jgi:1,3-beta-glucan synthase component